MPKSEKQALDNEKWIRMGAEQNELNLRKYDEPPEEISRQVWATVPQSVRTFVQDLLSMRRNK